MMDSSIISGELRMASKEQLYRIRCERVVNESWAEARKYLDRLEDILINGAKDDEDVTILYLAAFAFLQKATLNEAEDQELFGNETYS